MLLLLLACTTPPAAGPPDLAPGEDPPVLSDTTVAEAPTAEMVLGERAPDFVLQGADGAPIRLSDHEGDVVLIDLSGFL